MTRTIICILLVAATVAVALNCVFGFVGPSRTSRESVRAAVIPEPPKIIGQGRDVLHAVMLVADGPNPFFGRAALVHKVIELVKPIEEVIELIFYMYDYANPAQSDATVKEIPPSKSMAGRNGSQKPLNLGRGALPGASRFPKPPSRKSPKSEPAQNIHLVPGMVVHGARVVEFRPEGVLMEQNGRQVLLVCKAG